MNTLKTTKATMLFVGKRLHQNIIIRNVVLIINVKIIIKIISMMKKKKRKNYTADDLYNMAESVHCKVCGTLFLPKKKGDMFCGDACEKNFNTVKPAKIEKAFMDNDPWASGRFSSEITDNQFTGMMI